MFNASPFLVAVVATAVLGAGFVAGKAVTRAADPLCTLIESIEPEAKCELLAPKEGKVTMADKTEMYCKIAPKAGLTCKPITEPPKQAQPAPQPPAPAAPAAGQGSGANAPAPDASKPAKGK